MTFDFEDFGGVEGIEPVSAEPQWRWDPDESLSDWKITVKSVTGAKKEETYHVHKMVLATGECRSLYFVKMFHSNDMMEHKASKCIIGMEEMAADAFPDLLDFMYSKQNNVPVRITSESAIPLRFLANCLGIELLYKKVDTFMQEDLKPETASTYLTISTVFQDDKVRVAALQLCAENFGTNRISSECLSALSPALFQEIASLSSCDGLILSKRVAEYSSSNKTIVDQNFLSHLANATIMPKIDSENALTLLKLAVDTNVDDGQIDAKASLVTRCIESLKEEIKYSEAEQYNAKLKVRIQSIDLLDTIIQVKILKEMLQKASLELQKLSTERSHKNNQQIKRLKMNIEEVRLEKESLKEQLEEADKYKQLFKEADEEANKYKQDYGKMRDEIEEVRLEKDSLEEQLEGAEKYKQDYEKMIDENKSLKKQLEEKEEPPLIQSGYNTGSGTVENLEPLVKALKETAADTGVDSENFAQCVVDKSLEEAAKKETEEAKKRKAAEEAKKSSEAEEAKKKEEAKAKKRAAAEEAKKKAEANRIAELNEAQNRIVELKRKLQENANESEGTEIKMAELENEMKLMRREKEGNSRKRKVDHPEREKRAPRRRKVAKLPDGQPMTFDKGNTHCFTPLKKRKASPTTTQPTKKKPPPTTTTKPVVNPYSENRFLNPESTQRSKKPPLPKKHSKRCLLRCPAYPDCEEFVWISDDAVKDGLFKLKNEVTTLTDYWNDNTTWDNCIEMDLDKPAWLDKEGKKMLKLNHQYRNMQAHCKACRHVKRIPEYYGGMDKDPKHMYCPCIHCVGCKADVQKQKEFVEFLDVTFKDDGNKKPAAKELPNPMKQPPNQPPPSKEQSKKNDDTVL